MNRIFILIITLFLMLTTGCGSYSLSKIVIATDKNLISADFDSRTGILDIKSIIQAEKVKMVTGNKKNIVISDGKNIEILDSELKAKGMGVFEKISSILLQNNNLFVLRENSVYVFDLELNEINNFSFPLNNKTDFFKLNKNFINNKFIEFRGDFVFVLSYDGLFEVYNVKNNQYGVKINLAEYDISNIQDFSVISNQ